MVDTNDALNRACWSFQVMRFENRFRTMLGKCVFKIPQSNNDNDDADAKLKGWKKFKFVFNDNVRPGRLIAAPVQSDYN